MNQRALSQIGTPILIEDAMLYDELLKDNQALRATNDRLLRWLRMIRRGGSAARVMAATAIQEVEGC